MAKLNVLIFLSTDNGRYDNLTGKFLRHGVLFLACASNTKANIPYSSKTTRPGTQSKYLDSPWRISNL